jgi:uncharacterized spore protein YtfJ
MASNKTAPAKVTNVVHTLLDGLHSMSKSETIIGDPYKLGDATLVPVHRLRVALGAGSVRGGAKQDASSGESGGLGAGGAVQIEPVAVIAVGRDGVPRIMCVETEEDAVQKVLKQLPDVIGEATKVLTERIAPAMSKLMNRGTASAVVTTAKEALPETAKALLGSKSEEP